MSRDSRNQKLFWHAVYDVLAYAICITYVSTYRFLGLKNRVENLTFQIFEKLEIPNFLTFFLETPETPYHALNLKIPCVYESSAASRSVFAFNFDVVQVLRAATVDTPDYHHKLTKIALLCA